MQISKIYMNFRINLNLSIFFSILLKILTLILKFFLVIFLAKYLQPKDIGLYGLILASTAFGVYFIGFDFYTFSSREISTKKINLIGKYLKSQLFFSFFLFLISIPIFISLFFYFKIDIKYFYYFFFILYFEYLTLEISRVLIIKQKNIFANLLLFIKNGFWSLIVIILFIFFEKLRFLEIVFFLWLLGLILSTFFGFNCLNKIGIKNYNFKIDKHWIYKGIKVSFLFFISTLAIKFIFLVDKYLIQIFFNEEILAAYVLFFSFATTLVTIIETGIFQFSYPKLIKFNLKKENKLFDNEYKSLVKKVILSTFLCLIFAIIFFNQILIFLDKNIYLNHKYIFYFLLSIFTINILSIIPHYYLYAKKYDIEIMKVHIFSILIFILSLIIFYSLHKNYFVYLSLISTFGFILIKKTYLVISKNDQK